MEEHSMLNNIVYPRLRSIGNQIKDPLLLIYKQWAPLLITQAIVMFAAVFVVILAMLIFLTPLFYGIFRGIDEQDLLKMIFSGYFWVGLAFIIVPMIVVGSWGYAAMISALRYRKERMAPIGETLKKGLQLLVPMIILTVITTGAMFGASLMLIFPAVILCLGLSVAWYIRVLENTTVLQAIATSWEITKGYKWSIFGRMLLFMCMVWGVMFSLAIISMVPVIGLTVMPVQFALNFIITPYAFAYFFCIYDDLRAVRKDVYPMKGGLSAFMIISWILAVAVISGIIITAIYLIQTQL